MHRRTEGLTPSAKRPSGNLDWFDRSFSFCQTRTVLETWFISDILLRAFFVFLIISIHVPIHHLSICLGI